MMQRDHSTKQGAEALKRKLEEYYRLRGEEHEFWVEPLVGTHHGGTQIYAVRSNIKLGAPK